MKTAFYILLFFMFSCDKKELYDNVYFEPNLERFCGTYFIDNNFIIKNKISKNDTIMLILKEDLTFEVRNYPIKKYLSENIDRFINTKGTWSFTDLESIKNTPKNEQTSSIGLSLNFDNRYLNDDKKNVLKKFENIQTNLKDSTKYILMTYFLDSDDSSGFIQFRKE